MRNYGRDQLWDSATWADLDQAVTDEVKRVRVARRVFRTEDVRGPDGSTPFWVSTAAIAGPVAPGGLSLPEGPAEPFVEISVPFWLTPAEADAEVSLQTAHTLARRAARDLAFAEDQLIFQGAGAALRPGATATNTAGLVGVATRPIGTPIGAPGTPPERLLRAVNTGIAALAGGGFTDPYALVLDPNLYADYVAPLPRSTDTPSDRLERRLKDSIVSGAVPPGRALLVSVPSESTTVYTALEPLTAFTGEMRQGDAVAYGFRVFERFQYATRDPGAIQILG